MSARAGIGSTLAAACRGPEQREARADVGVTRAAGMTFTVVTPASAEGGSMVAGQGAALQAAAATLFGSNDGGLSAGLAGALGLDILTVRSAGAASVFDPNFGAAFPGQATTGGVPVGTVSQNVVAIGKRLGSRVFVTYEQGLRGIWNILRIQYDITHRLSIRVQAGTDSALDMLYFYSFD